MSVKILKVGNRFVVKDVKTGQNIAVTKDKREARKVKRGVLYGRQ